mmetsp:Transcript_28143/g.87076  ORF Transcript_28143/g.87076 Transcript_28143/m.87076 type:complete len:598 (-) Transcript_28143:56-1849(-)
MEETSDAKRRRTEGSPAGFDDVEEEARAEEDVGEEEEPDWDAIEAKRLEEHERILRTRPTRLTHPILDAPEFRPTREEFLDPIAYLEQIREEAEAYGIIKVIPPDGWAPECGLDWESPKRFATKRQRIDRLQQSQPYDDGRKYTLKEYRRMANRFMDAWLTREERPVDIGTATDWGELYDDYWNIVDRGAMIGEEIEVEYGNDVDAATYWSGFPAGATSADDLSKARVASLSLDDPAYYAASGWNLNNIALWPGSLLRRHDAPLPGVNTPWLYLGMLFGTFPWHNEDNYFESINYHHAGAPKQWYGVPGAEAAAFEDVVRRFYKQRLLEVPDLLHRINLQVSPAKLIALGVPVKRLTQRAGEFVVTFPQAFHGGFSYGFNCGEAVNFATRHWIAHARLANERYRRAGRLAVVSHDRLMFTLKANEDDLDAPTKKLLLEELRRIAVEDLRARNAAFADGVRAISHLCTPPANKVGRVDGAACDYDDKRVCAACKHTCFLSAVASETSQTEVCCLRHVSHVGRGPPSSKYMIEWEPRDKLESLIAEIDAELGQKEPLPTRPSPTASAAASSPRESAGGSPRESAGLGTEVAATPAISAS